jgi:hypothetical protein
MAERCTSIMIESHIVQSASSARKVKVSSTILRALSEIPDSQATRYYILTEVDEVFATITMTARTGKRTRKKL